MRLVLCWANISGYMAACWRALAAVEGVDLRIIAWEAGQKSFDNDLVRGLNCRLLTEAEQNDAQLIRSLVKEHQPDVLYTSGWFHPHYRSLIFDREFEPIPKWIGVDTPWMGTLKQQLGRIALRRMIGRLDRVFVAGERAWQYLRHLGAPEGKISRGLYGVDYDAFHPLHAQRAQAAGGWPRKFLFIGRYAPEKGLDVLVTAYRHYRAMVKDPWPLTTCGRGPNRSLLEGVEGIEDLGFRQPADLIDVMRQHGVFVLPSTFDPWPLVVVESCSAGLPVICTEACGSAVEVVRSYHNGLTVPTADPVALARGMRWMHEQHDNLPKMGLHGCALASAYSAQMWATRWAQAMSQSLGT